MASLALIISNKFAEKKALQRASMRQEEIKEVIKVTDATTSDEKLGWLSKEISEIAKQRNSIS